MGLVLVAAAGAPLSSWAPAAATPGLPWTDSHYNGMIAPLKYLSVRTALFAHGGGAGEVGAGTTSSSYGAALRSVVRSWRALMPVGDFGFNVVQLGHSSALSAEDADAVRLAQARLLPGTHGGGSGSGGGGEHAGSCVASPAADTFWDHTKCGHSNVSRSGGCCETEWGLESAEACCTVCQGSWFGFACVAWEYDLAKQTCYMCSAEVLPHRSRMAGHSTGCLKRLCNSTVEQQPPPPPSGGDDRGHDGSCGVGLAVSYDFFPKNRTAAVADRLALATLHSTYAAQCGGDENRTDCDAGSGEVCWWAGPQPTTASFSAGQKEIAIQLSPCSAVGLFLRHEQGGATGFQYASAAAPSKWISALTASASADRAQLLLAQIQGTPARVRFAVSAAGTAAALLNAAGIALSPFELSVAPAAAPAPAVAPAADANENYDAAFSAAAALPIPLSPPMGYNSWNCKSFGFCSLVLLHLETARCRSLPAV